MKTTSICAGILIIGLSLSCTTQQINSTIGGVLGQTGNAPLSANEVARGLKEALTVGISKGSEQASTRDGYFKNPQLKIPFPPEVQKVESRLRQIGLGKQVDTFVETLNRGAEDAAKEAKPIFISAITSMTIQDAFAILRGDKGAATEYLRRTTSDQLRMAFQPKIKTSLDKVNATKYYGNLVNTYNKIPAVSKVNPNLDEYATQKAIDGLFILVKQEEANIRENPVARTTELLKRVFGSAG